MATGYSGWGWEQILGGVLGIGVPDRTQITGQTWLTTQHNAPANPGMHQIWAATWQNPGKGGRQSIAVYLNPALYAAGGAWDTFLNAPSAALSGVPTGNSGALPMNPRSFQAAQAAVASVASWLGVKTQQFSTLGTDVASGSSGFRGSGGEVVAGLLNRLSGITAGIHSQMTNPVAYSDTIAAAGDSAAKFLTDMWSAHTSWTQVPPYSPLGALVQVVQGVGADPRQTSHGDLTTDAAWAKVENEAKALWLDTLTGLSGGFAGLDPLSQKAFSMLVNQYATTTSVLDPLLGPASRSSERGQASGPQNSHSSSGGPGGGPGGPGGAVVVSGAARAAPGGPGGVSLGVSAVVSGGTGGPAGGPAGVNGDVVRAGVPPGGPWGAGGVAVVSGVVSGPGSLAGGPGGVVRGGPGALGGGGSLVGGPLASAHSLGLVLPPPVARNVLSGGTSAIAPLASPAAGGGAVPAQSLAPQASLLVPTALLTSRATGTAGANSHRGLNGSSRPATGLDGLLAASQLGALSGSIGRPTAGRVTRRGTAGRHSSGPDIDSGITADSATGSIPGQSLRTAPVAGFSLGSNPNGPVVQRSVIPTFGAHPGVTVTSFNTQAVPRVQALPGGGAGSVSAASAVPGGALPGVPGTLAVPGGVPARMQGVLALPGGVPSGGPAAGTSSGAGGPLGPSGPLTPGGPLGGGRMAAGQMIMMPPGVMGGAPQQDQERVRDAFAPEDEEYWGTEPGLPGAPITPDDQDGPEPQWRDTESSPFEAIGIGADREPARRSNTKSDGRVR